MNSVEENVLKSLQERIELAKKRIEQAKQDIVYQNKIIAESKNLILKLEEQK